MTKEDLKDLIKECIVEVLAEGLTTTLRESKTVKPQRQQQRNPQELALAAKRTALDGIRVGPPVQKPNSSQVIRSSSPPPRENVSRMVEGLTNDPIMSAIFADTASSTLMEQVSAESGRNGSGPTTGVDPSMFEGSANWATLAFADKRNSR